MAKECNSECLTAIAEVKLTEDQLAALVTSTIARIQSMSIEGNSYNISTLEDWTGNYVEIQAVGMEYVSHFQNLVTLSTPLIEIQYARRLMQEAEAKAEAKKQKRKKAKK